MNSFLSSNKPSKWVLLFIVSVFFLSINSISSEDVLPPQEDTENSVLENQKNVELYQQNLLLTKQIQNQDNLLAKLKKNLENATQEKMEIANNLEQISTQQLAFMNSKESMSTILKDLANLLMMPISDEFKNLTSLDYEIAFLQNFQKEVAKMKIDYLYEIENSEDLHTQVEELQKLLANSQVTPAQSPSDFLSCFKNLFFTMKTLYSHVLTCTYLKTIKLPPAIQNQYDLYSEKVQSINIPYLHETSKYLQESFQFTKKLYFDYFHHNFSTFGKFVSDQMSIKLSTTNHIINSFNENLNESLESYFTKHQIHIIIPMDIHNKLIMVFLFILTNYYAFKLAIFLIYLIVSILKLLVQNLFPFFKSKEMKEVHKPQKSEQLPKQHFKPSSDLPNFNKPPSNNENKPSSNHENKPQKKNTNKPKPSFPLQEGKIYPSSSANSFTH